MSLKGRHTKSALISVALHLAAVAALFSKPIHLQPRFLMQIGKTPSFLQEDESITILKRNQALEETFSYWETAPLKPIFSPSEITKILQNEKRPGFEPSPALPPIALSLPKFNLESMPLLPSPSIQEDEVHLTAPSALSAYNPSMMDPSAVVLLKEDQFLAPIVDLHSTPSPKEVPTNFEFIPLAEGIQVVRLSFPEQSVSEMVYRLEPSLGVPIVYDAPSEKLPLAPSAISDLILQSAQPRSVAREKRITALGEYGFPSLQLREWNEFFDIDVKTYRQEDGRFLFTISLIPRVDLSDQRLKQNFLFVIDRSNSIDKHRYQASKRAVNRAISTLREGDYFNVLLLDSSVTRLSEKPIPYSRSSQQQAEEFLEKQPHGHYRAATDIYSTLTQILTPIDHSDEAVTAILISDGDSSLKSSQQRKKINTWLEANRDRIALYTATAGHGNNLSSLKMLGLASRGSLLYSDTHAAFPRKLAKLVIDLRSPIAKEMTVSVIPSDPSTSIELLPPSSRLPYLFSDHPFVLMGSCSSLADFMLVLEGKNKDQVLTIKKMVSLSKAKPGSRLLPKQWAAEKAHTLFDQYLREGESSLLEKASKQFSYDTQNSRR